MIEEVNVECLSLSRTEALCGYPFDFTAPGTEDQDERALHAHRENLSREARNKMPVSELPDEERHEEIVLYLRHQSAAFYDLQQIVRLIAKMPTLGAWAFRHAQGKPYVYPDNDLSYTANFL